MNCPVCKYPNAAGATHCGMCYEVFNRSAAQSYLHAVKKERREKEGIPEEPQAVIKSQELLEKTTSAFEKVDWRVASDQAVSLLGKLRWPFFVTGGVIALWMAASFLFSANLWYHLLGHKLGYEFSAKTSAQYLVGMKQNVKVWSERQGRLDTPMEDYKIDELGNVLLDQKPAPTKNQHLVQVTTKEWIQILNDAAGQASHALPKKHPSLAGARLLFDKKGVLLERHFSSGPRLAKSLPFLTPRFPKGSLRRGQTWEESVDWLDVFNDWKIYWTGTMHWTIGELEPCGDHSCAKLTYAADLRPHLRGGPSWMQGVARGIEGTASTEGAALFDTESHLLRSNTFSYDGLLHIPITDLGRIPWELRVGRRVKGQPGEIVIHFDNTIDIRKN